MFVLVMSLFIAMFFVFGPDKLFRQGTYDGTVLRDAAAVVISVFGALVGGWVCVKIARSRTPVVVLAVIVLVLGLAGAFVNMNKPDPGPRPANTTFQDLMRGQG